MLATQDILLNRIIEKMKTNRRYIVSLKWIVENIEEINTPQKALILVKKGTKEHKLNYVKIGKGVKSFIIFLNFNNKS